MFRAREQRVGNAIADQVHARRRTWMRQFEPCAGRYHPVEKGSRKAAFRKICPKRPQEGRREIQETSRRAQPMITNRARKSNPTTRRKFLAGAALTGAAAIAMPQVSRAQTITWKYQSTWPTKDIFHEDAVDYAKKVNEMSGGRLKLDVLAA